ncbi:MAG: MerR family transcriptional regulator [Gammaproteobacteria bacterium]
MESNQALEQTTYGIGTAASLSGLTVHTIRVWERRYSAVEPGRTDTGRRRYSMVDVERLSLLKQLTDLGESISTIAALEDDVLKDRLASCRSHAREMRHTDIGPVRLAVLSGAADRLVDSLSRHTPDLTCVTATASIDEFKADIRHGQANVLLLEYPAIDGPTLDEIVDIKQAATGSRCVVLYRFARAENIRLLEGQSIVAIRAPADGAGLLRAITSEPALSSSEIQPEPKARPAFMAADDLLVTQRMFTDGQLTKLAALSTSIQCECPAHLADLVRSLSAFEVYSSQCENGNPEDAELHAYLHAQTARARSLIETAIDKLLGIEGIELNKGL